MASVIAAMFGVLMPDLVARVNRSHWPSWARLAVALAASVVAGTVGAIATGELSLSAGWWSAIGTAFIASQVAYRTWWHRDAPQDEGAAAG